MSSILFVLITGLDLSEAPFGVSSRARLVALSGKGEAGRLEAVVVSAIILRGRQTKVSEEDKIFLCQCGFTHTTSRRR